MTARDSTGLMAFWADIDESYVEEFRRWHNCEHVGERVGIPGFNVGRRYRGIGEAPMFFMFYETDDADVLKSAAYLSALNSPTPWTQASLRHFRNPVRTIYRLAAAAGTAAPSEAPYLFVTRFDVDPVSGPAWLRWYGGECLSMLCALPGVFRGRLYEADEAISGLMTSERGLYAGGPGRQKHCALIELAAPDLPDDPAWRAAEASATRPPGADAALRDVVAERYWLDFVLYAPNPD
ncbi:MAG: hypothetical protein ACE5GS_13265 [Kiloniellaceae bacterium]